MSLPRIPRTAWLIAAAVLACAAPRAARAQYDPDWSRHFRVGALVGFNIKTDFRMNGTFNGANHTPGVYSDGYVLTDSTGNEGGVTTYWGYDNNPGQYDPAAHTLTFHDTASFSATGSGRSDDTVFAGFDLAYGGNLLYVGRARIGWEFGFGLLPINTSARLVLPGSTVTENSYQYSTMTPDGPLQLPPGAYRGPRDGSGTVSIPDTFSSASSTNGSETVTSNLKLDAMLYTFRLGPTVYWDFNPYWGISAGAGPALGFLTGQIDYTDNFSDGSRHSGSLSDSDILFGGYANVTLMYHVTRNGDLYVGAQYMPLGKATLGSGGRQATVDLRGGVYLSAGVNWPF